VAGRGRARPGTAQAARADGPRPAHLDAAHGAADHQSDRLLADLEDAEPPEISFTYFRAQVTAGNVADIVSTGNTIQGDFKKKTAPPAGTKGTAAVRFKTELPTFVNNDDLDALLARQGVVINAKNPDVATPLWQRLLIGFAPTLLIVGLFIFISRRMRAGLSGGPLGAFGKSQARRYERDEQRVTFKDVAGIEEATEELHEVVDFLRSPEKYTRLGARVPRGVLLSGAPGTGKTLLARAVAGEADVPFFSIAASEFIEAIVGVGASRVRDLFNQAKAAAPAIIFIDELDAIGRVRGSGSFGGNDEREQTLNQILTEMDGFTGSEESSSSLRRTAPRCSTPRCSAPGASTGASSSTRPTSSAASRSWQSTPARCRSPTTPTSHRWRPRRREWSAPTSRTSSTRPRCSRPAAGTSASRWPTSRTRSRRSCSAPSATSCCPRPIASAPRITSRAMRCSAC